MKTKHKRVLRTAAIVYAICALILLPWVFYLAQSLPTRHISWHWDISWVGLDIGLAIALVATGLLAYWQSRWVVISATILGSILLLDAWFDILSQRGGGELQQAVLLAMLVEIPLAIASFILASKALVWDTDKRTRQPPQLGRKKSRAR